MLFRFIFPLFFLFAAIAAEEYQTADCRFEKSPPFLKRKNQKMPMPRPAPGKPLTVSISAEIMSLSLDEEKQVFETTFIFRQEWKDPRLAFEIIGEEKHRAIKDAASIWTPDLFFVNKINETSHNVTVQRFPDGRIFKTESKTVRVNCRVDLLKYPFDTQTCQLQIESYGYTMDDLIVQWNETENVSAVTERLLRQTYATSITSHTDIISFRDAQYISPSIVFSLSRTATAVIFRVLLPMVVIIACSWTSFTFTRREMGIRVGLCLSPILTYILQINFCMAYFISPSYLTSLDVWAVTSMLALSVSATECIYISYNGRPEDDSFVRVSWRTDIKRRIALVLLVTCLDAISIVSVFLSRLL